MLRDFIKLFSRIMTVSLCALIVTGPSLSLEVSAAEHVFTESEINLIISSESVESELARIEQARISNDPDVLLEVLAQLEQAPEQSRVARAYLRYTALMAFASLPESNSARTFLQDYLGAPQTVAPQIAVWREDDGHRSMVVAFDASAAARFSLGSWNMLAWSRLARAELAGGKIDFIGQWLEAQRKAGGRLAATGLVDALSASSPAQLSGLPTVLQPMLAEGKPVAELARVVAVRLADQALAQDVIRHADGVNALAFLSEIHVFPLTTQLALTELASERNDLGSAAIYRMASIETNESRNALMSRLGSRELGNSVAAALARSPGPGLLRDLATVVTEHADPLTCRRAILSLHLMQDAESRDLLDRLSRNPKVKPEIRNFIVSTLP